MTLESIGKKGAPYFYFIFRVVVGFFFFTRGSAKLLGWFGGFGEAGTVALFSFPGGASGIIELVVGLLLIFGFLTRLAAGIGAIEMITAYVMAHLPRGVIPLQNGGESAILFLVAFLVLFAYGSGKWALDNLLFKRKK